MLWSHSLRHHGSAPWLRRLQSRRSSVCLTPGVSTLAFHSLSRIPWRSSWAFPCICFLLSSLVVQLFCTALWLALALQPSVRQRCRSQSQNQPSQPVLFLVSLVAWLPAARFGASFASWQASAKRVRPNPSLHPGPATAGGVSPVCASGSIVTHRAYTARLRGPGELER